ncbi:MAG: glycosyltransferase [Candidatus Paceibacterota bacterium]
MEKPLVSIIMPCRFKPEITRVCLDSLESYTDNYQLILIQDGEDEIMSNVLKDYGVEMIDERIYNEIPQGWVKAINQGMKKVSLDSEYVIFLNDDVVITPYWLDKLIAHFEKDETLGIVGPITNQVAGKQHINYNDGSGFEETNDIIGFCMVFRKSVLDELYRKDGYYMDERFGFGGQDDIDICWRAKKLGYKIGIVRDVFIYHYGSKAFRELMNTEESQKYAQSKINILNEKYGIV